MMIEWPLAKTFPAGRAMVACKHPAAGAVGLEMLRQGGSAVDAAAATSIALGVVEPYASGIGGGGLALYQLPGKPPGSLHFGMRAPASARPDMFEPLPGTRDEDLFGWLRTRGDENIYGPRSVALPGLVAGLHRLWEIGGRLPWRSLIEPAVELARATRVDWQLSLHALHGQALLSRFPTSRAVFLPRGRAPLSDLGLGYEVLQQVGLARTLEAIAEDPMALGHGRIAQSIVDAVEGRFSPEELQRRPGEEDPLTLPVGDLEVHLMPGGTGGATVLEWLGILQELDPPADENDIEFWWAVLKAGEVAMRDRLERLCDPEFSDYPDEILGPEYHRQAAAAITAGETGPVPISEPATGTSHVSAVDEEGTAITITQTLLSGWGSGLVTPGTGILLNNGMMWFDPVPGSANSIEGGKRPLANMCPILITRKGEPYLAYGASGGRKIMPAIVQIFLRVAMLGQSLAEAIAAPRIDISREDVIADVRFGQRFADQLGRRLNRPVLLREPALGASPWASPVGLMRREDGEWSGGADPYTLACVLEA